MSPIVSTIDVARPPEEVFAYVTDPTRFAEWQRDVVRVHPDRPGTPDVGSRFSTTRRVGGTMTQEVTELDAPRRWAVRGVDGRIRPSATITVEPIDAGSRVTFTLDFEGHGVGVPLAPLVRRQAEKGAPVSYRNLKTLLEAGHHRRRRPGPSVDRGSS
jgi:uncharacterized protein YndB with AHSA1/START domain